jgi:hypothetical protein
MTDILDAVAIYVDSHPHQVIGQEVTQASDFYGVNVRVGIACGYAELINRLGGDSNHVMLTYRAVTPYPTTHAAAAREAPSREALHTADKEFSARLAAAIRKLIPPERRKECPRTGPKYSHSMSCFSCRGPYLWRLRLRQAKLSWLRGELERFGMRLPSEWPCAKASPTTTPSSRERERPWMASTGRLATLFADMSMARIRRQHQEAQAMANLVAGGWETALTTLPDRVNMNPQPRRS